MTALGSSCGATAFPVDARLPRRVRLFCRVRAGLFLWNTAVSSPSRSPRRSTARSGACASSTARRHSPGWSSPSTRDRCGRARSLSPHHRGGRGLAGNVARSRRACSRRPAGPRPPIGRLEDLDQSEHHALGRWYRAASACWSGALEENVTACGALVFSAGRWSLAIVVFARNCRGVFVMRRVLSASTP